MNSAVVSASLAWKPVQASLLVGGAASMLILGLALEALLASAWMVVAPVVNLTCHGTARRLLTPGCE